MKNKSVFKYLVIAVIFLLAVISISVYKKNKQTSTPLITNPISNKKLEVAVFSAVNDGLKVRSIKNNEDPGYYSWDEKVEIEKMDTSLKAATGKWWASDAWDWIAWQLDNGSWKVLLSFDGYNCQELETVPSQYDDFFKDQIYPSFWIDQPNEKYCY